MATSPSKMASTGPLSGHQRYSCRSVLACFMLLYAMLRLTARSYAVKCARCCGFSQIAAKSVALLRRAYRRALSLLFSTRVVLSVCMSDILCLLRLAKLLWSNSVLLHVCLCIHLIGLLVGSAIIVSLLVVVRLFLCERRRDKPVRPRSC